LLIRCDGYVILIFMFVFIFSVGCGSNNELKVLLMSSLEASAAAKKASGRRLELDDQPNARYDAFRDLSARCAVCSLCQWLHRSCVDFASDSVDL
jgi:hypothetical protein